MSGPKFDVETGKSLLNSSEKNPGYLLTPTGISSPSPKSSFRASDRKRPDFLHLSLAFLAGLLACALVQRIHGLHCFWDGQKGRHSPSEGPVSVRAAPQAGSTERHPFPPPSPTNIQPTLFPTDVGYAGGTPTGAEPAVVATAPAYPLHIGAAQLVVPGTLGGKKVSRGFNILKSWGNLSPWYSLDQTAFGLDSSPGVPGTCRVTGLHLLHRHGARYPSAWASYAGVPAFAGKPHKAPENWNATGELDFLNEWTYKLGEGLLTPFGRQQLYDLGVSMRMKYGFLLKNFTESNSLPVFRTTSQDRMLKSALNFASGFFGYPLEGQYQQSIIIEGSGFNNTLAPYDTCPNYWDYGKADRGTWYTKKWAQKYPVKALPRLQAQIRGLDLTIEDLYAMQQLCAYETVALGYSKYCGLFTEEEWKGFDYSIDLNFWYNSGFGSPLARAFGVGYIQEMVARLTHTPISTHNTTTNSTLNDNPITFPLGQSLYVDATHENVILNVITALNLVNLATNGPLPYHHIPRHRSFKVTELAPLASNVQFQVLECTSVPGPQIRVIINDAVTPLTGINGCPEQKDGMCPVDTFVAAQNELVKSTDWNYACHGDWKVPEGPAWNTTTGSPPDKV